MKEMLQMPQWPGENRFDLYVSDSIEVELLSSMPSHCCAAPLCNEGICDSNDRL